MDPQQVKSQATTRRRKTAALLAGGLVLGIGAAVTLAAWNDSEFATAEFTAGSFVFQGSTDGTTFEDHASEGGAASLTFSAPATHLSPDDAVYAPFALRLTGSTGADLTAHDPVAGGSIANNLSFAAVSTDTFGCDEAAFNAGAAIPATLAQGETVNLCLRVSATADLEQGQTGDVLWQWEAVSTN